MSSAVSHDSKGRLFKIGIFLKGLNGLFELISAAFLLSIPAAAITRFLLYLAQRESGSGAKDWVYRELGEAISKGTSGSSFPAFYLISHGIVKVGLATGLLLGWGWAYPTALGVFGALAGYELYRFIVHPGFGMAAVLAIDLAVLALIWSHWRSGRKKRRKR